jgi:hypothetical protein
MQSSRAQTEIGRAGARTCLPELAEAVEDEGGRTSPAVGAHCWLPLSAARSGAENPADYPAETTMCLISAM